MITNVPIVGKVVDIAKPVEKKVEFYKIKTQVKLYYLTGGSNSLKEFLYTDKLEVSDLNSLISTDSHIPDPIDSKINEAIEHFYYRKDTSLQSDIFDTKLHNIISAIDVSLYGFDIGKRARYNLDKLPERSKDPMDIYVVPELLSSVTYTINPIYNKRIVQSTFVIFTKDGEKNVNVLDIDRYQYQLSKKSVYNIGDIVMGRKDGNTTYTIDGLPYYNDIVWNTHYILIPCTASKEVNTLEDYYTVH